MLFPQFASTAYSNLGVSLLGRTLEKATNGLTWEEWVETRIMEPLGMSRSGPCVRSAEEAAAIVDGVEPAAPRHVVPRPFTNSSRCPWDAPAGGVFSTPQDMARWADFLAGTYPAPDVLDPASIAELRNSAMLQADGISAIGGGTLENAFSHGRWTFNKLGCLPGYRSATTIVPELGLSVFAAAASTCDLHGDGDAVGFPIVSQLIPPLERLLRERFEAQQRALPAAAADLVGSYDCPFAGAAHISHSADGRLRLEHVGGSAYSWTLLPLDGQPDAYRKLMEELPRSTPACSSPEWPGANLCHTSCFREMARGDVELLYAKRDAKGRVRAIEVPGDGVVCVKT